MKQFSCGDVVPGCRRTFTGSQDDVLAAVQRHAEADHGLAELTPELVTAVRAQLRDVAPGSRRR